SRIMSSYARTVGGGERLSGISLLRMYSSDPHLAVLTFIQVVFSKYGDGYRVHSTSQPALQWKMALLDLSNYLLPKRGALCPLLLHIRFTLHVMAIHLECYDSTPSTISLSRNLP